MAITVEEGGEGVEAELPCNEELLAVSPSLGSPRSSAIASWPFCTAGLELLSNSISRICSCLISSLESGIKYLRTSVSAYAILAWASEGGANAVIST